MTPQRLAVAFLLLVAVPIAAAAESGGWTDKLFDKTSVDFKYVARGSTPKAVFTVTNTLDRRLHIANATPS